MGLKNKEDQIAYSKKYYQEHIEEERARSRAWARNNREKHAELVRNSYRRAKNLFFEMYGSKCACCGEETREFLTLDHVKGQVGKKKQKTRAAYGEAIKKYDPEKFRILCRNCNWAIGFLGYCPHERNRDGSEIS
ncbi:hypothetical protein LCGC14_0869590 [marine sediment metagenome]|uniref:HNH domain-containing protein n=1 Tax=marine sediment metagenome TaxID=412755 RepID=A0A0F9SC51_9ZZZZ